ncbi:MAG: TRAP transporter small permease [Hyphomicrobiaceae bacterium]
MPRSLIPTSNEARAMGWLISAFAHVNWVNLAICRIAAILFCASIAIIVAAGVFFRYVLNDSLSWAEELSKFCMLWMVFVGSPIALRAGNHIAIEVLPSFLPERLEAILKAAVMAVVIVFLAVLAWNSWGFAWNGRTQTAIAIGDVSMFWIFVSIPVGSTSMLLVAIQLFLEHLVRVAGGEPPEDGFMRTYGAHLAGEATE